MEKLRFKIPNLHCKGCADRSANILEQQEGVKQADVTFDDKSAEVEFDSGQISFEQMKEALAKADYAAEK